MKTPILNPRRNVHLQECLSRHPRPGDVVYDIGGGVAR